MNKPCKVCGVHLKEGDTVLALCVSQYHELPSRVAYAISPPMDCIDVMHLECHEGDNNEDLSSH